MVHSSWLYYTQLNSCFYQLLFKKYAVLFQTIKVPLVIERKLKTLSNHDRSIGWAPLNTMPLA